MILAGPLLQRYFTDYLIAQRRLSPQTLASYRDTFRLLLQFVQAELKIEPSRLAVDQLDTESCDARTPWYLATSGLQLSARSSGWRRCMTRSVLAPQLASWPFR
jgi:site-specific recombinase XerC